MEVVLNLVFIALLIFIFFQDFKEQKIYVGLLLITLLVAVILYFRNTDLNLFLLNSILNLILTSVIVVLLYLYTKVITKRKLFESIGLGDLLFWGILAVGFPTHTFLLIFIFSVIFSYVITLFYYKKGERIPLAGLQSMFLILLLIINYSFNITNLYLQ